MSERLNTRGLAEHLANQTGMDRKRAEDFIDALALYFMQGLERNKTVKIAGLGVFKILLVRERESIHIQTGERFAIPAHHKITFQPDKDFKEQINRPFALFEAIEATENEILALNQQAEDDYVEIDKSETITEMDHDEYKMPEPFLPVDDAPNSDESDIYDEASTFDNEETRLEDPLDPQYMDGSTESYEDPFEPQSMDDGTESYEDQFELLPPQIVPAYVNDPADNAYSTFDSEKKKKRRLLWLVLTIVSLSCIFGSGMGLYWFLKTNSDKSIKLKLSQDDMQSSSTFDSGSTLVDISISGDDQQDMIEPPSVSYDQTNSNSSSTTSTSNQEEKIDRNWLVPLPDNTKPEMRRADRPNQEIEARNRSLANNSRQMPSATTEISTTNNRTTANVAPPPVTASANTTTSNVTTPAANARTLPARIKIKAGSTLMQLALDYYGDKVFWVYIYQHNQNYIKNFNNIPIGTELLLPEAKTYGIDAKSAASKDKALQIQRQLMRQ